MKFKEFRIQRRFKQCEVARASGIDVAALSLIENEYCRITPKNTAKLQRGYKRLGVNEIDLFINEMVENHNQLFNFENEGGDK